jgi:formate hydrogenlyase subunit 4
LLAAALVPSFARGMLFAPFADLLLIAGLLALGRFAMALAGMDVGTSFGGLGATREMAFAALAEPALVLAALIFAILAGTTNLDVIIGIFQEGTLGLRVSLGFAAVALLAVAVAENARIPVDNPATHLELTMVHEAMILESSGRHLALWDFQASLRLTLWLALLAAVFLPFQSHGSSGYWCLSRKWRRLPWRWPCLNPPSPRCASFACQSFWARRYCLACWVPCSSLSRRGCHELRAASL